ncbi:MAG: hypothetical protein VX700_05090 [Pseudomonadota bacterium]|nr:hypothetical protein [Pseudomonadota bacterium]
MLFKGLFSKNAPTLSFSPDIPEEEKASLLSELNDCANRRGGSLQNARRAKALGDLFNALSPTGKEIFANLLAGTNDSAERSAGERYSEIEEAELFGGSDSKLAVLEMFETPRRRLLAYLGTTPGGRGLLHEISALSPPEVRQDIRDLQPD